ncbi:MAG TPA: hypothetical protein VNG90_02475 [Candidatus Acidoferrum sp.]|nr:hypothetical protein [Candidatus Acidoferrum sp.]
MEPVHSDINQVGPNQASNPPALATAAPAPAVVTNPELSDKETIVQMLNICRLVDANRAWFLGPQASEVVGQPNSSGIPL